MPCGCRWSHDVVIQVFVDLLAGRLAISSHFPVHVAEEAGVHTTLVILNGSTPHHVVNRHIVYPGKILYR